MIYMTCFIMKNYKKNIDFLLVSNIKNATFNLNTVVVVLNTDLIFLIVFYSS